MDLREALENETVADVGYRQPVIVQEEQTVRDALDLMREKKAGCLLILNDGQLMGIFTERDLMTRVFDKEGAFDATIAKFMTINPVVARSNEPIHRVLARMYNGGMRHLPVLDIEDRPVGTISVKSVVHFLAEYHPTTVYNLPPVPDHFASRRDGG